MARVEDYNSYVSGKNRNFSNEHYFIADLKYTDIHIENTPPDFSDVDDSSCEVEYEARVMRNKMGIDGIDFIIHKIELEIKVDDYPNEHKKFEFEIEPMVNIDPNMVIPDVMDRVVPTYPTSIVVDMRKSMEVRDFKVVVQFGNDAR